jgi:hypothetical protein
MFLGMSYSLTPTEATQPTWAEFLNPFHHAEVQVGQEFEVAQELK